MASMLVIAHRDGREYAVAASDFHRNKDGQYDGFRALRHEDGEPYEAPAPKDPPAKAEKPAAEKQG